MAKAKKISSSEPTKRSRPALTPEARELQLVALAVDLAEQQLREGTASSQVITHYLKLGTMKERLEREKLEEENKLLRAKTAAIESGRSNEEMLAKALKAFGIYSGRGDSSEDEEY